MTCHAYNTHRGSAGLLNDEFALFCLSIKKIYRLF